MQDYQMQARHKGHAQAQLTKNSPRWSVGFAVTKIGATSCIKKSSGRLILSSNIPKRPDETHLTAPKREVEIAVFGIPELLATRTQHQTTGFTKLIVPAALSHILQRTPMEIPKPSPISGRSHISQVAVIVKRALDSVEPF
ncbi:hypothetical protein L596_006190 [Steinernema carpocapsae]|uniref:Uncharacterized protein n=1 Tax=Steinernema carpocapsae TaxID=34508 RepID=A0A4U8V1C6_STECR|nr:hypothetical protein L596_006190 [Steinernema carpocapsae]